MHLGHDLGPGLDEPLVAALELGSAEVVRTEVEQLQVRPHGAVEDDDPLAQGLEVRRRGRVEPTEEFGGGSHRNRIPGAPVASRTGR